MRIDLWLKKVCLLKSRSLAKSGCRNGRILLGGVETRESRQVSAGDEITLCFPQRIVCLEVLDIPRGNVARRDAGKYYRILSENPPDTEPV